MSPQRIVIPYYRVSTQRQGSSGLGLDAQRSAVAAHVTATASMLLEAYTEIESGRKKQRPQLMLALKRCREVGAVLVIAKLDRLSRNAAFLGALMNQDVEFCALDLPDATRLVLQVMASIAEYETKAISDRTVAALQAAKARGRKLGNPDNLTVKARIASAVSRRATAEARHQLTVPLVRAWRRAKWSLQQMADGLAERGIPTPRGGTQWNSDQVRRVLAVAGRRRARPQADAGRRCDAWRRRQRRR